MALFIQPLSLQFLITELKQEMFPLWSIKGKGIRKGQGTCWAPSFMPSALARTGFLTFPENLLLSYMAEKLSPGKAGRGPSGKTMDPVKEEPTTSQPCSFSHIQCPAMPGVTISPPTPHAPFPQLPTPPIHLAGHTANTQASERQRQAPSLAWEWAEHPGS